MHVKIQTSDGSIEIGGYSKHMHHRRSIDGVPQLKVTDEQGQSAAVVLAPHTIAELIDQLEQFK